MVGNIVIRDDYYFDMRIISVSPSAPTLLAGTNPLRHFLHIQNINEEDVYISTSNVLSAGHGWLLNALKPKVLGPGELEVSQRRGNLTGQCFWAISTNGKSGRVCVVEYTAGDTSIQSCADSSSSSSST